MQKFKMADNEGENEEEEVTAKQKKNRKKKEAAKRKKQAQKEKTAETSELPDGTREAQAGQKVEPNNVRSFVQEISENPSEKFQQELDWCIEQLELGLLTQKPDKKQAQQANRHLKSLRSSKTPLPKKRQVMFSLFGDYRKKMQDSLKQNKELGTSARLSSVKANEQRSIFVKVSHNKTMVHNDKKCSQEQGEMQSAMASQEPWNFATSDNTFRFNFGD